jgi:hypothetical protein
MFDKDEVLQRDCTKDINGLSAGVYALSPLVIVNHALL